jgi:endonuclease YncB( thermonuclease family)
LVLATSAALVLPTVQAPPAESAPRERVWETGKVTGIGDGDTVWVRIKGTRTPIKIRLTGINAAETKHKRIKGSYTQCNGPQAKRKLRTLVLGKKVRLKSMYRDSRGLGRPLRTVMVKKKGRWINVNQRMVKTGHAMAYPQTREWINNARYQRLSQAAALRGKNFWNRTTCGAGPAQEVPLRVWANYNADGVDNRNVNGEYVTVLNQSRTTSINLRGWKLRDTALDVYTFPSVTLAPGRSLRVHVGKGSNTADRLYWGKSKSILENVSARSDGDGVYLMDPSFDLRTWSSWPCKVACTDPVAGKVVISQVQWDADGEDNANPNGEWVRLTNRGSVPVDLRSYQLRNIGVGHDLAGVLRPGATLTVKVGRGTNETGAVSSTRYWGNPKAIFSNSGGWVGLFNSVGTQLSCSTWGKQSCPGFG